MGAGGGLGVVVAVVVVEAGAGGGSSSGRSSSSRSCGSSSSSSSSSGGGRGGKKGSGDCLQEVGEGRKDGEGGRRDSPQRHAVQAHGPSLENGAGHTPPPVAAWYTGFGDLGCGGPTPEPSSTPPGSADPQPYNPKPLNS